jgi:asparagine synthase (glutamine-hydrolysing)
MCGIAGVVRFDGGSVSAESLQRACAAMQHRGPDDSGVWTEEAGGNVGLAATRLAIYDPTPAGHQPMHRDGRFHLVYNGALYNFREIRRELIDLGESFQTESDTEVLLAACVRWGVTACRRFNGMWAFAFYDSVSRRGFLCRDRFGIKPLLYQSDRGRLSFASEMGPLLAMGPIDETVDTTALLHYLQFGWFARGETIHRDVRRLEPGQFLSFSAEGASEPTAWTTPPESQEKVADYAAACATLRRLLGNAVTSRRTADVPVGAFLSGGLDSSIVVAHHAESSARPVRTFSVGFADQPGYDETGFARLAARRFATEHTEIRLTTRDILESIPRFLDHLSEPFGDSSIVPTALVAQVAARDVKVALSGDGGDELFAGYWRYLAHGAATAYRRIPAWIRANLLEPLAARATVGRATRGKDRLRQFRKLLRGVDRDPFHRHLAWSSILAPEARDVLIDATAAEAPSGERNGDSLQRILTFDLRNQLPADMLAKVDLAAMMHSLEARVPFLDDRVAEFAASLPIHFKIDRGRKKRILVDAYRGILPDEILDRPKKGFEVPVGEFLRGPLEPLFRDVVTQPTIESFGVLRFSAIQRVFEEHRARRADHADLLFAILSLCWWHCRARSFAGLAHLPRVGS